MDGSDMAHLHTSVSLTHLLILLSSFSSPSPSSLSSVCVYTDSNCGGQDLTSSPASCLAFVPATLAYAYLQHDSLSWHNSGVKEKKAVQWFMA